MFTDYDVIIAGSGCAGLAAAIYTSRAGFETMVLEKAGMGGELVSRQLIENYPGFAEGIMGPELAARMVEQAEKFGAELSVGEVVSIEDKGGFRIVRTHSESYTCKAVILATGSHPRLLNVPGETEFASKGVFYCATCDGAYCAGKPVVVAGAGDSGITEALLLSNLGCRVTVVELMAVPKASQIMLDRAEEDPNITVMTGEQILGIEGDEWVTGVKIKNVATGEEQTLDVSGIYVRIGQIPNTQFLSGTMTLLPNGQVPVDQNLATEVKGIFAAGDIRQYSPMQVGAGTGDGITAAMSAGRYLNTL